MDKDSLTLRDYLLIVLMMVLFVAISLVYHANQNFSYDQTQMLLKGFHAVFNNEYLPFGNEASSMGNIPGCISSWVIGFPLELYVGVESIIAFQMVLRIAAILIFANALSLLFGRSIVMLGTFLFALGPWYLYHTMIYNPAYIHFGSAIVLNCLIRLRASRYAKNKGSVGAIGRIFSSLFLVLAVGFILQLHYSWTVVAAICGILWLRRDIKVSYIGVFLGLALFAWSMLPYFQEIMVNKTLLNNPEVYAQDRYIGYGLTHVYPIFKGILYWLRFGSLLITNKAIFPSPYVGDLSTLWTVLSYFWVVIAYLIGSVSVLFSAYSNYFAIYKFRLGNSSERLQFVRALTLSSLLAVILASAASPVTLNFWQVSVVLPFALMPILAMLSLLTQSIKLYFWVALLFFAVANPIAALCSDKFYYKNNLDEGVYSNCLIAFTKDQCAPYAKSLTPEQKQKIEEQHPTINQNVINRVIKGIIPSPQMQLEEEPSVALDTKESGDSSVPVIVEQVNNDGGSSGNLELHPSGSDSTSIEMVENSQATYGTLNIDSSVSKANAPIYGSLGPDVSKPYDPEYAKKAAPSQAQPSQGAEKENGSNAKERVRVDSSNGQSGQIILQ